MAGVIASIDLPKFLFAPPPVGHRTHGDEEILQRILGTGLFPKDLHQGRGEGPPRELIGHAIRLLAVNGGENALSGSHRSHIIPPIHIEASHLGKNRSGPHR